MIGIEEKEMARYNIVRLEVLQMYLFKEFYAKTSREIPDELVKELRKAKKKLKEIEDKIDKIR